MDLLRKTERLLKGFSRLFIGGPDAPTPMLRSSVSTGDVATVAAGDSGD
jgi:hypothetical protein